MITTAAYLRISSDRQDVARQRESIQKWADSNGHHITHWFEDSEGRNARDQAAKRTQFQAMLKAIRSGVVKIVIVDAQDRFGTKDAYEFGKFLTILRENNCQLWSVSQGELTKDDDATVLTNVIGALTSTREQKEKATRNVGGKVQRAKAGEYQGGYPAYGIDVVCFNGVERWRVKWVGHFERWKVYPDGKREAFNGKDNFPAKDANDSLRYRPGDRDRLEVVRNIFTWYATEDISPGTIAARLNKLDITTTVGTPWNKVIVKQLLLNPVYVGLPAWNKRGGGRFKEYRDGLIQDVEGKAGRKRDPKDFVQPEKPEFDPIVDLETWNKVQTKIEANRQGKRTPAQVADWWLKPFLICGRCGKPMRACSPQPRMEYGSYFCGTYGTYKKFSEDNPHGCFCHRVKHSILAELVEKYLDEVSAELETVEESGFSDSVFRDWMIAVSKRNKLWVRIAATVTEWGDSWDILDHYQPADSSELIAEIEAKKQELDELLAGFFKLSPVLQQRANDRSKVLEAEIEALQGQVEDLTAPWKEATKEVTRRSQALRFAMSLHDEAGPRRAEALRKVIDKIVCHYRYTERGRSIIDSVEIYPVSGEMLRYSLSEGCFTEETWKAPG